MRIYRMTATFGKLEQETLALEPGLNILQAENEWGKSTWCAFLVAMFYGLDTRAKTTKTALADKERFAPWSGSPMSGRVDLHWRGRDISIERTTRGRIPMGEFRAYETATGLSVPELNAANCGALLLGVEQSVFRRSGFIRFSDLPVTQDDALRRRLNALVTTGDESADGERLERRLRELKNKCRYNRTGLLPQAEGERDTLGDKLRELEELEQNTQKLRRRLEEVAQWKEQLQNHQAALDYTRAKTDADRVAQAEADWEAARQTLQLREERCAKLPSREEAERKIRQLRDFQEQWQALTLEAGLAQEAPEPPAEAGVFAGLEPEEARRLVNADAENYRFLRRKKPGMAAFVAGALSLTVGILLAIWWDWLLLIVGAVLGLVFVWYGIRNRRIHSRALENLEEKYGSSQPEQWFAGLEAYDRAMADYRRQLDSYRSERSDLDARLTALQTQKQSLCGAQNPEKVLALWQQVLQRWEEYQLSRRECQRSLAQLETLRTMAKQASRPAMEDSLRYTAEETARLISDAGVEQQRLQNRIGQYQGRMEALGLRSALETQYDKVCRRIEKLEEILAATELALDTLTQAKRELQRRFAPRISKRAQELMGEMTGGRYRQLSLGEDFRLAAATGEETVLRDALWRSEGTVDQLYLALRLAVAEELTPHAPLVLDDALVRFDDQRLRSALNILNRMAERRQILLFTCHSREKTICDAQREGL